MNESSKDELSIVEAYHAALAGKPVYLPGGGGAYVDKNGYMRWKDGGDEIVVRGCILHGWRVGKDPYDD